MTSTARDASRPARTRLLLMAGVAAVTVLTTFGAVLVLAGGA